MPRERALSLFMSHMTTFSAALWRRQPPADVPKQLIEKRVFKRWRSPPTHGRMPQIPGSQTSQTTPQDFQHFSEAFYKPLPTLSMEEQFEEIQ